MSDELFDVSGRTIVLTGACGLIGRTLARAFHERGARVGLVDIPAARPAELAASLGEPSASFVCDVSQSDQVARLRVISANLVGAAATLEYETRRCGERSAGGPLVLLALPDLLAGHRIPGLQIGRET